MQYHVVLLFKNQLIGRKELRILTLFFSRNFHHKIFVEEKWTRFPIIKIALYRIKPDINQENKKRIFEIVEEQRWMMFRHFKDSSRYELLSLSLNNSRQIERKRKIVRALSNQDAMQCTCAIVKLGQGGLHGVLDSRSA